jgi:carboxymethylenebutenolidase
MADVEFKSASGELVSGYLADTDLVAGNVVVIHEWWGLNDQVRSVCDRFAQANFRAFAPDLYDGVVIPLDRADEAGKKMGALDWGKAIARVRAGCDQLRGMGGKVAVTGFCMGGAITLLSAMKLGDDLDAAVPFYGIPPAEAGDPAAIKVPVLGHFAKHDDWVTPAKVDALDAQLAKGNVPHTLHRYDAHHAFFNEARKEVHDPAAAKLAWDRTIEFLTATLK